MVNLLVDRSTDIENTTVCPQASLCCNRWQSCLWWHRKTVTLGLCFVLVLIMSVIYWMSWKVSLQTLFAMSRLAETFHCRFVKLVLDFLAVCVCFRLCWPVWILAVCCCSWVWNQSGSSLSPLGRCAPSLPRRAAGNCTWPVGWPAETGRHVWGPPLYAGSLTADPGKSHKENVINTSNQTHAALYTLYKYIEVS